MVALVGAGFDRAAPVARERAVEERRHQPPGADAREDLGLAPSRPPPSRWSLRTIRAWVDARAASTRSGVWRLLDRLHLHRRSRRAHLYRPDPDASATGAPRAHGVREAVRWPAQVVLVVLDERGSSRWPAAARDGMPAAPSTAACVHQAGPTNRQQRLLGALNARTGPVDSRATSLVGRAQVSAFSHRLDQIYAPAQRLDVGPDTWSIHPHDDGLATLAQVPRMEPVWLPTDAPWLTPSEQLWHGLRRDVLNAQRLADDSTQVRQQVNAFLDQLAHGSPAVLRDVGLRGDGHLACVLRSACLPIFIGKVH